MKNQWVLIADIGNTSAHLAICRGMRVVKQMRLPTRSLGSSRARLARFIGSRTISRSAMASVVPDAARKLRPQIEALTGGPCVWLGRDRRVPVANRARRPGQVGVDRLLNALACHRLYRRAAIVVDFGTAITFDVVSRKGEYLGGVIAPGIEITLDALYERTALLPKTKLRPIRTAIGRDTVECIRIGASVGIGGLCDRIIERIQAQMGGDPLVLATGGYASFMKRYSRYIRRIDPLLTLKGILLAL